MRGSESERHAARVAELEAEIERLRAAAAPALEIVQRHRAIFDSSIELAMIATDRDGRVTDWNRGAALTFGWSAREMHGEPLTRIFTPEDQAADRPGEAMRCALADGRAGDERWHLRQDGSRFWGNGELLPLRDPHGAHVGFLKVLRDQTLQRRNDETQRADAEFQRSVLAASADCIKVLDLDGALLFMSEGGQRVMEVSDFNAIEGCSWPDFWQGEGREQAQLAVDAARIGGTGHFIGPADTFAGNPRWWDVQVTPIRGADGGTEKLLSVSRDITESRRVEEALREAQSLNSLILGSARDCIVVLDLDGNNLFVSPGGVEAMEVADVGAIIGLSWLRVWHGADHAAAKAAVAKARAGGIGRFEGFCPTHNGTPKWWDVVITPLPGADGRPERLVSFGRDVTLRKVTEERLARSEERLQLALGASGMVGIWDWDLQTDLIYSDANFARLYSVDTSRAERGAPFAEYLKRVHPADVPALDAELKRFFAARDEFACEYRVVQSDGSHRWVMASGRMMTGNTDGSGKSAGDSAGKSAGIGKSDSAGKTDSTGKSGSTGKSAGTGNTRDSAGAPLRFAGATVDITAMKLADAKLQEWNATLEQRVDERTRELADTHEQLRQSQKMEAVGQLTGGLAHDFNNLLAGITGSLELVQRRVAQGRLGEVERYLTMGQEAVKRAASLTHRLLAFSRRQTLDPKPTDIDRLIVGMEDLLRRTVGPTVALSVVATPGLWLTLIDPNQLENALLNLCINARDAMPGGGRLTIETANCQIDERAARERNMTPGPYLSVCVTDTGSGMAPEVIERIFEPFFTTKPMGMGTGLGLSMVYGFALQSGGQVRVYSELGIGTTMCVYLPRLHDEQGVEAAAPGAAAAPRADHGETVLVIDDEATVRVVVTEVLRELGYAALEAADGATGLALLHSAARVDLLVTDVGLSGGLNGRQVADAARLLRPGLKVLFITGYAENAVVGNGLLPAGMQVLTKPFAMDLLGSRIKSLLATAG